MLELGTEEARLFLKGKLERCEYSKSSSMYISALQKIDSGEINLIIVKETGRESCYWTTVGKQMLVTC